MAELQWVVDVRALMARVEQVNPQASFQPDGLARTRPTPYPLLPPDVPVPVLLAPSDKLFFYSGSVDAKPGKGVNEVVKDETKYAALASNPHWRRILSNFHVCPFKYNGKTYRTIEHAFQASKIALTNPSEAEKFTVESGDTLGQGDGLAARTARKLVVLSKDQVQQWENMSRRVMEEAARAKYQQCPEAMRVLLATQDAELWHIVTRGRPDHFVHLETIRAEHPPAPPAPKGAATWSQGPPFDLADALRRGVAGQRRTGSHKQFTFVFPDDPTWIYKGPYSAEKVSRYAARVAVLRRWALPNVVLPDERVFPASVQGPKKELFLRFPNLAKEYPVETEAGVHKESFSTYEYTVLKRTVLVKAKDVIGNKEYPWALAFVPTLTYQLAALALLDVGDVHLSNVLVDLEKKEFFIIDVEETRHQPAVGPWAFFTKPPAAPLQPLWTAELRKGLPSVVEALRALPVGPDLDDRRTALIKDLETYYPPLGAPVPSPPPSPPRLSARPSAPRVPPAAVVATAPIGAQGQMSYLGGTAGLARSLTYSGLRLDVAKSGMQKYMRRARADDALVMAFEIFRFREIPVGAVITNLRNRLSVAAAEDVGPADVPTVLATLRVCNDPTHVLTDLELFDVVVRISASAKSRVCSWVARTYGAQADAARAAGVAVDRDDTPAPATDWPWRPDDPPEVVRLGNLFYDRLKKKDLNVFKWAPIAEQAWAGTQLPKAWPGTRRTKPTMLLWRMLDAQGLPKDVLTALEKAYDTVSETTPFLRLGLWLCVQGLQPPGAPLDIQPTYTISDLLTGKYRVVVDEFVVDKHTKAGRGLGFGRTEFAVEGSKVVNEDPRFVTMSTDLFRRLYEL